VPIRQEKSRHPAGLASFAAHCSACPLRARCTTSKNGRQVRIHAREQTLQRARSRQRSPTWKTRYRATDPNVERKFAHLMRRRHAGAAPGSSAACAFAPTSPRYAQPPTSSGSPSSVCATMDYDGYADFAWPRRRRQSVLRLHRWPSLATSSCLCWHFLAQLALARPRRVRTCPSADLRRSRLFDTSYLEGRARQVGSAPAAVR